MFPSVAVGGDSVMALPKGNTEHEIVKHVSGLMPKFEDLFDEETFYICAFLVVCFAITLTVFLARHVKLKDAGDHLD